MTTECHDSKSSHKTNQNVGVYQLQQTHAKSDVQWSLFKNLEEGNKNWFCICSIHFQSAIVILGIDQVSSQSWLTLWLSFSSNLYFLATVYPLPSWILFPVQEAILWSPLALWQSQNLRSIQCLTTVSKHLDFYRKFCNVWSNHHPSSSSEVKYAQCISMKTQSPSNFRRIGAQAGALIWWHFL